MPGAAPGFPQSRNNPWLDLIRSIAILLVLFRHGEKALHAELGEPQGVLQTIFMNGWVGVDLFFVLSGYLISRHLMRAGIGSGRFHLGRYLATRALRIVPAYYAVLLLVVIGVFPFFPVAAEGLSVRVAYHLLFLQDYLPSDINVVFWSLGVEEKFYLLAPLLIFALLRCQRAWLRFAFLLAIFILPVVLRTVAFSGMGEGVDYPTFWRLLRSPFHMALEGLVFGVGIAIAEHAGFVPRSPRRGLATLLVSSMVLAIWLSTGDFMADITLVDVLVQPPLLALLAGMMTLGAVALGGTPMLFTPAWRFLSRLSYSLYLIHFPLVPLAMPLATSYGQMTFWIVYLVASLCAALVVHVAVERPFLRWKERLEHRENGVAQGTLRSSPQLR